MGDFNQWDNVPDNEEENEMETEKQNQKLVQLCNKAIKQVNVIAKDAVTSRGPMVSRLYTSIAYAVCYQAAVNVLHSGEAKSSLLNVPAIALITQAVLDKDEGDLVAFAAENAVENVNDSETSRQKAIEEAVGKDDAEFLEYVRERNALNTGVTMSPEELVTKLQDIQADDVDPWMVNSILRIIRNFRVKVVTAAVNAERYSEDASTLKKVFADLGDVAAKLDHQVAELGVDLTQDKVGYIDL